MSHARIEEVSDSDPDEMDIDQYLPDSDKSIIAPADIPPPRRQPQAPSPQQPPPEFLRPQAPSAPKVDRSIVKAYQCLYPVYFDSSRTRTQGRRVSSALATPNPLAYTIVDAVSSLMGPGSAQLKIAFEPDKLHPKDWANPGRVRVQLLDPATRRPLHPGIKNKHHLYLLVARYLQAHPTQVDDPRRLQIQGLPMPEKLEAPAKPRGWKISDILPVHSPAMTGGGVNENFMGDMMKEMQAMQGGQGGGMAGLMNQMGGGGGGSGQSSIEAGGKKKKEKEKGQTDRSGGGLTFGHSK